MSPDLRERALHDQRGSLGWCPILPASISSPSGQDKTWACYQIICSLVNKPDPNSLFHWSRISEYSTSLVVQWLGVRLSMQGTRVRSLIWEDSTCLGVTKLMYHQLLSLCSRTLQLQVLKPASLRACALQREATAKRSPSSTNRE